MVLVRRHVGPRRTETNATIRPAGRWRVDRLGEDRDRPCDSRAGGSFSASGPSSRPPRASRLPPWSGSRGWRPGLRRAPWRHARGGRVLPRPGSLGHRLVARAGVDRHERRVVAEPTVTAGLVDQHAVATALNHGLGPVQGRRRRGRTRMTPPGRAPVARRSGAKGSPRPSRRHRRIAPTARQAGRRARARRSPSRRPAPPADHGPSSLGLDPEAFSSNVSPVSGGSSTSSRGGSRLEPIEDLRKLTELVLVSSGDDVVHRPGQEAQAQAAAWASRRIAIAGSASARRSSRRALETGVRSAVA